MTERRNGRWIWVGIVGTGVAIAVGFAALLGIPNCGELVTTSEAKEKHDTIRTEAQQMIKALRDLTAAEKERRDAEHERINQQLEKQEESSTVLRSRTWEILQEVRK